VHLELAARRRRVDTFSQADECHAELLQILQQGAPILRPADAAIDVFLCGPASGLHETQLLSWFSGSRSSVLA
jgi:hypothetical protein